MSANVHCVADNPRWSLVIKTGMRVPVVSLRERPGPHQFNPGSISGDRKQMDMDRGVRGWLLNTCKENYWRVAGWYDFEDLIQDGMLHYVRVSNKYPHVTSQKHLGALFRTAFTNHIHDLSKRRSRIDCEINECLLGVPIAEVESVANTQPDTSLIMAQLPPILRSLLNTLQDDPRAYRRFRRRLDGTRETNNDHLCRLIGLDPTSTGDVLQSLHRHLIGRPPKIAV